MLLEDLPRDDLVDREGAGADAAPHVRETENLQETLERPVLSRGAVENGEHDARSHRPQSLADRSIVSWKDSFYRASPHSSLPRQTSH